MSLSIFDRLDDAVAATRSLLLPFDSGRWLRLTVLALLVGGGSSVGGGASATAGNVPGYTNVPGQLPDVDVLVLVAAVVGILLLIGLVVGYLACCFEFALVDGLATREVAIRANVRRYAGQAARLFGFRLVLFVLAAATVLLPVAAMFDFSLDVRPGAVTVLGVLGIVATLLVVAIVAGTVHTLTTMFVVPTMYATDRGVLACWRHLWSDLTDHPFETVGFVLLATFLSGAALAMVGTVAGIVGLVVVVPVAIVSIAALGLLGPLGLVVVVPVVLLGLLSLAVVSAALRVPVVVGMRYYALLVLSDLAGVDLLEATREATNIAAPR
ncbi:DUF7544 domain-containing protein [Halosegnis longus]|uniref:DUF7544 domain-containing protein n=1 Tax=Halosegnis longus TaxID=2216012 RepID=UPI00096A89AA|nr:hypothetical protein [Salella cibi]